METLPDNLVNGAELMRIAATYENQQVLEYLLNNNVDPSDTNCDGWNSLHFGAHTNKKSTKCIELLLKNMKVESINKVNNDGETPLDYAYYNGSPIKNDIILIIRQAGGKANLWDENGIHVGKNIVD